jgi:hypothetical protein
LETLREGWYRNGSLKEALGPILLVVEAGVEVVVEDGVVAVAPLPHRVLIFTPCNALLKQNF